MNRRDVTIGMTVYHGLFTHLGPGIVKDVCGTFGLEAMFEGRGIRVVVQFNDGKTPHRLRLSQIRKTPNRKKIKEMVAVYQSRGVDAKDGGDQLIIPRSDSSRET